MTITSSALPISPEEFRTALLTACRAAGKLIPVRNRKLQLGLAVSGGVDSMALAALYSQHNKTTTPDAIGHAFTVDHAARPGSGQEAEKVGHELRKLGFQHQILEMRWPDGVNPLTLPDFESQARKYRCRALGAAAWKSGLDALLFAHHEDDQVETVLMRLASTSLQAMRPVAQIPECGGMYGVYQSGKPRFTSEPVDRKIRPGANARLVGLEDGGIMICRPLLNFSKERLAATCRAHQIPWFEDSTNTDPTLTKRNAVRHLLEHERLPTALRKESVLKAVRVVRTREGRQTAWADKDFKHNVISLDLRSGVIHVRFGPRSFSAAGVPGKYMESEISRVRKMAATCLREIVNVVTPDETVYLAQMNKAVDVVYPKINGTLLDEPSHAAQPVAFTVAGVCFTPISIASSKASDDNLDPEWTWKISRQPYLLHRPVPKLHFPPTFGEKSMHDAASLPLPVNTAEWHLFDGRFWFRVENRTPFPITLRPLMPQDIGKLRQVMTPERVRYMNQALLSAASGKVRETLPVFAKDDGGVLAIPTLGVIIDQVAKRLRWKVSFKKINLTEHDASVIIRGNNLHHGKVK